MTDEMPQPYSSVQKIELDHDTDPCDCGRSDLNRFLKRSALVNRKANTARTCVVCRGKTVVAYSLTFRCSSKYSLLASPSAELFSPIHDLLCVGWRSGSHDPG